MSAFDFNDFLLFSNAKEIDEHTYASISAGVLDFVANQYGIYTDTMAVNKLVYLNLGQSTFEFEYGPLQEVDSITFNEADIDFETYEFSQVINMAAAIPSHQIPLMIYATVGYDGIVLQLPQDLKVAIYRHIEEVFFAIKNNVDNLEKVINATGNTMYYHTGYVSVPVQNIYNFYSYKVPAEFRNFVLDENYRED